MTIHTGSGLTTDAALTTAQNIKVHLMRRSTIGTSASIKEVIKRSILLV